MVSLCRMRLLLLTAGNEVLEVHSGCLKGEGPKSVPGN